MWNRHVCRSKTVDSQQSHVVHYDLLRNDNSDLLSTYCMSGAVIYLLHKLAAHWRVSLSNQELPSSNASGERGSLSQFVSRGVCLCLWKSVTLRLSSLSLAPSPALPPPTTSRNYRAAGPAMHPDCCCHADTAGETNVPWVPLALNFFLPLTQGSCVHKKLDGKVSVAERIDVPHLEPACPGLHPGPDTYYVCNCDQLFNLII